VTIILSALKIIAQVTSRDFMGIKVRVLTIRAVAKKKKNHEMQ
jgi:hypothetical protein